MKINFKRLEIYEDESHRECYAADAREAIGDLLYKAGCGIACHALALKIFNSDGEEEYTEKECNLLLQQVEQYAAPVFVDAIQFLMRRVPKEE